MTATAGRVPQSDLRDFLRSRRARIGPEEVGVAAHPGRRRVPGLRREEVAQLAGVSVDYYTRLEQGRTLHVSAEVLDAVARALRLDATERSHLFDLARPQRAPGPGRATDTAAGAPGPVETAGPQRVRAGLCRVLDALDDGTPAMIMGRRLDVLAANRLAEALYAGFGTVVPEVAVPGTVGSGTAVPEAVASGTAGSGAVVLGTPDQRRRNLARFLFLDPAARTLFADWESAARGAVAALRFYAGRHPYDPGMRPLVDELAAFDGDFRRWWAGHDVLEHTHGTKRFRHPAVGELALEYESLTFPDDPDQTLYLYTAEPGSPSDEALRTLASRAPRASRAAGTGRPGR
ncbi:helix-turn-helix domain-containing protein [Streptomyces sp. AP-93]|uniref:helix-turn-helix domain-containing protein n=1 Tax=Streptomyces sp. AP-93 TaxID=2929048 RepID=UPI001FAFE6DC|nr:helix-turn-helix transcriptional regulator [Streptomyces sp. AP-93]MCJ0869418.1 helix-turn-helix transcriptional regulator [Streptomyces sp. AP-93]